MNVAYMYDKADGRGFPIRGILVMESWIHGREKIHCHCHCHCVGVQRMKKDGHMLQ